MSNIALEFLGAAQTVTGSMHLLRTPHGSILFDCGLFQGRRAESREKNEHLPREAVDASALVLTHAHIDHSGSIPTLVKRGFQGDIYATPATRDLCSYMLRDSARIQTSDAEYLNERYARDPDWTPIQPLYTEPDAVRALRRFTAVPYGRSFSPLPGVRCTFIDAGHILGSAQVVVDIQERTRHVRLVISGDLGRKGLPILRDPEMPPRPVDYVVMESTYGHRVHGDMATSLDDLERVVKRTVERKGKVIVPAFALGRTQELVFALNKLKQAGRLPDIPVFIDSPLSVSLTEVFKLHPDCFDDEALDFAEQHGEVFDFSNVRQITSRQDSMALNRMQEPAIIIASSGMCEAGRVVHHLRNNIEDDRNTVLIVGFMAKHTLGRKLVERQAQVRIFGVERWLRAEVAVMNAFSAHADKHGLMDFAQACGKDTKQFFLVHGEPDQQEPLAEEMRKSGLQTTVAEPKQVSEL